MQWTQKHALKVSTTIADFLVGVKKIEKIFILFQQASIKIPILLLRNSNITNLLKKERKRKWPQHFGAYHHLHKACAHRSNNYKLAQISKYHAHADENGSIFGKLPRGEGGVISNKIKIDFSIIIEHF